MNGGGRPRGMCRDYRFRRREAATNMTASFEIPARTGRAAGRVAPLWIGLAGLTRPALHDAQQFALQADCRIEAVCDFCAPATAFRYPLNGEPCVTWRELLADPAIELVVLHAPLAERGGAIREALEAGKRVACESPICTRTDEARELAALAARKGLTLSAIAGWRWDGDFRTALAAVESGKLGTVRSARIVSRQYAPESLGGPGEIWAGLASRYVDQLLQLVTGSPQRVWARRETDDAGRETGFQMAVESANGATGFLDVSLTSLARIQTGWLLEGTAGGYLPHSRFRVTAEGEVVETPLEPLCTAPEGYYAALVKHLREGVPCPAPAAEEVRVVEVLEAARMAAREGGCVELENG